jgi:uncharacterized protein (DUF885 family)
MKNLIYLTLILSLFGFGCQNKNSIAKKQALADTAFYRLSEEFLKDYLAWRPIDAVYLGFHEYDGKIPDLSMNSINKELERLKRFDQLLAGYDTAYLSKKAYFDLRILHYGIKDEIFNMMDMQSYTNNPITYASALDLSIYLNRNFAPLEERVKSIIAIENKASEVFNAAKSNLNDSLPKPYLEIAIPAVKGSIIYLQTDMANAVKDLENDSIKALFDAANNKIIEGLKDFVNYLEKEKQPKAIDRFAIGKEKYEKMLADLEGITIPVDSILKKGLSELKKEQKVFNRAAQIIDAQKKPILVYRSIQKEHPSADHLISDVSKSIDNILQFIKDKNIVSIPSETNLTIKETPKFRRSQGTASLDAPGPFEKVATEGYFFVTPVEPEWTSKQKEEWLSMFDRYTTDVVTIHEAYPGHYMQFIHLNASPVSKIEKIFGSYAFIEGWAHYSEKMMLDEGYGNNGDPVIAAKYRMSQSGDALLRLCRLCVSIKMHCDGMTVNEATRFFMDNWYQGEKPSQMEALRGTYDPGYLFYTFGKWQMLKLRDDYYKQEGANFSLQKFHNLVLDNGMPQMILLREKLLKDRNTWSETL